MNLLYKLIMLSFLTSCATTAYNRSFIMGDSKKVEFNQEPVTQLERNSIPVR
jgi:hypothetical protein